MLAIPWRRAWGSAVDGEPGARTRLQAGSQPVSEERPFTERRTYAVKRSHV